MSFLDVHQIRSVSARVDGPELGEPRPVRPPVRSGSRLHPAGARPVLLLRLVWTVDLLPTSGSTRAGGGPALV